MRATIGAGKTGHGPQNRALSAQIFERPLVLTSGVVEQPAKARLSIDSLVRPASSAARSMRRACTPSSCTATAAVSGLRRPAAQGGRAPRSVADFSTGSSRAMVVRCCEAEFTTGVKVKDVQAGMRLFAAGAGLACSSVVRGGAALGCEACDVSRLSPGDRGAAEGGSFLGRAGRPRQRKRVKHSLARSGDGSETCPRMGAHALDSEGHLFFLIDSGHGSSAKSAGVHQARLPGRRKCDAAHAECEPWALRADRRGKLRATLARYFGPVSLTLDLQSRHPEIAGVGDGMCARPCIASQRAAWRDVVGGPRKPCRAHVRSRATLGILAHVLGSVSTLDTDECIHSWDSLPPLCHCVRACTARRACWAPARARLAGTVAEIMGVLTKAFDDQRRFTLWARAPRERVVPALSKRRLRVQPPATT